MGDMNFQDSDEDDEDDTTGAPGTPPNDPPTTNPTTVEFVSTTMNPLEDATFTSTTTEEPTTQMPTTEFMTTLAPNACDDERTHECPENSFCVPAENFVSYTCQCNEGFFMNGNMCKAVAPLAENCPADFRDGLFKMKLDAIKNPMYFMNQGSVLIQVESQVVSRFRLNEETYTAFIEFTRKNCGNSFLKAFGAGQIDVQVMDVAGSEGLYDVVAQRGFYFKNQKGYDGLGGATVQITKNFPTLGAMVGDDTVYEANQGLNARGRIAPLRDTFYLVLSGEAITAEMMGTKIDSCFNPLNLQFFIHNELVDEGYEVLSDDYTKCYYEDKMANHLESDCLESAVINGQVTEDFSLMTVLFESDFPQCIEVVPARLASGSGDGEDEE